MEKLKNIPSLRFPEFKGEWEFKRIGEITIVSAGATPSTTKKEYWGGKIRWMNSGELNLKKVYEVDNRITELGLKKSSTKLIPKHSILIGLAGQGKTRGTVAMNMIELCTNQSIGSILPNENYISEFFYHNLDNRYEELRSLSTGDGGRGGLNLQIIKTLPITLPNLQEQTKIASFLTAVDDKLQALKQKKTLLEQYKKGVMQKIFSQELRFKDDNGNEYPDWEEKKLGDVVKITMGQSPNSSSYNSDGYGIPLIQGNADIKNRVSNPRNWTTEKTKECKIGDLLLTVRAPVGAVAKSIHNACIGRGVCSIINNSKSNIEFIYQFLLDFETKWGSLEQGSTFTAVSGIEINKLEIILPSVSEQTKIANFLSTIDDKINHCQEQIVNAEVWKKGLLQKMFC
jgi:type I restriction enzyme S subunit